MQDALDDFTGFLNILEGYFLLDMGDTKKWNKTAINVP